MNWVRIGVAGIYGIIILGATYLEGHFKLLAGTMLMLQNVAIAGAGGYHQSKISGFGFSETEGNVSTPAKP